MVQWKQILYEKYLVIYDYVNLLQKLYYGDRVDSLIFYLNIIPIVIIILTCINIFIKPIRKYTWFISFFLSGCFIITFKSLLNFHFNKKDLMLDTSEIVINYKDYVFMLEKIDINLYLNYCLMAIIFLIFIQGYIVFFKK